MSHVAVLRGQGGRVYLALGHLPPQVCPGGQPPGGHSGSCRGGRRDPTRTRWGRSRCSDTTPGQSGHWDDLKGPQAFREQSEDGPPAHWARHQQGLQPPREQIPQTQSAPTWGQQVPRVISTVTSDNCYLYPGHHPGRSVERDAEME